MEVRIDRKAQAERERVVVALAAIEAFDFVTAEGSALVVRFAVARDALALERPASGGNAGEWEEVALGEAILGKKKKEKKKKGKKESEKHEDEPEDDQQQISLELRIEGDDAKRTKVKEAFLVALSKAKEATVKGKLLHSLWAGE